MELPRAVTVPPVPVPAPAISVDDALVPGLRLPAIAGLPQLGDRGMRLDELVAPPAPGTPEGLADLALVHDAQTMRTPAGDAWAVRMAKEGARAIWFDLAERHRERTGRVQGWLGTALLASTLASNGLVTEFAKRRFDRARPYQVDPSIKPPVRLPYNHSYPSGHTSSAFAAARVIAELEPSLAREAWNLATQVAVSRVYAGVHFPSDVVAGAKLGIGVAEAALRAVGRGAVATSAGAIAAA